MRRIISITLAIILVLGNCAFASPVITSKDAGNNIIGISGEAVKGDVVSVIIINPGYALSDVYTNPSEAQQYVRSYVTEEEAYSFDVTMNVPVDGGGKYTAVVNAGGKSEKFEFSFYPIEAKNGVIENLNDTSDPSDLTDKADGKSILESSVEIYGLDAFVLTGDAEHLEIANIILNETSGNFKGDADEMYNLFKASIYVAALNNSSDKVFESGYLIEPESLGVKDTATHIDYLSSVNDDGLKSIEASMLGADFETVDEAIDTFDKNVVLNLITNNVKYGNGHVESILEKYDDILTDAGFRLSRLSSISKKSKLYDLLVSSNAKTLEAMAKEFNNFDDSDDSGKSSSGGGSSKGSVGGSNTPVTSIPSSIPDYIPSSADVASIAVFDDLGSSEWAREAIEALASNGIVNGKGNNKFDPDGKVTRAEFTKMIIGAAGLTDVNAQCSFEDVTDAWAKPYVASASRHGIVNGIDDKNFGPYNLISREQAAVIAYRTLLALGETPEGNALEFKDSAEFSDYAVEAISKLSGAKIINGKGDNTFAPKAELTRAEAAKIIFTAFENKFIKE